MAKIDLEKLICSLAKRKYFSEEKLQYALKEQGLEYKDGEIVQKPLYEVGNIIIYKGHYYYIKEVVKDEERDFYYNLVAIDGGKVSSIGPAGEKDITLLWKHTNIQQNDFAPKATTANRQVYNRAILKVLSDYVEKYPDIRFGQMLCNLDVNPHFNEESRETYWDLSKTIIKKQNHE